MTPAVRQALAYTYLTGKRPAHIRLQTSLALHEMTDFRIEEHQCRYIVKPEFVSAVKGHAMVKGARWLEAQGFNRKSEIWRRSRPTSHYISYWKYDDDRDRDIEAMVTRSGYVSVGYGRGGTKQFKSDKVAA